MDDLVLGDCLAADSFNILSYNTWQKAAPEGGFAMVAHSGTTFARSRSRDSSNSKITHQRLVKLNKHACCLTLVSVSLLQPHSFTRFGSILGFWYPNFSTGTAVKALDSGWLLPKLNGMDVSSNGLDAPSWIIRLWYGNGDQA